MSGEEPFLSRWSRLKREQDKERAEAPVERKDDPPAQAPALPPVEKLTPESDFSVFMHPKVQDSLRRVALKKLFSDPHFNVPDLNEAYSGDWTGGEPISQELLAQLEQVKTLFRKPEEAPPPRAQTPEEAQPAGPANEEANTQDEPGRKDA